MVLWNPIPNHRLDVWNPLDNGKKLPTSTGKRRISEPSTVWIYRYRYTVPSRKEFIQSSKSLYFFAYRKYSHESHLKNTYAYESAMCAYNFEFVFALFWFLNETAHLNSPHFLGQPKPGREFSCRSVFRKKELSIVQKGKEGNFTLEDVYLPRLFSHQDHQEPFPIFSTGKEGGWIIFLKGIIKVTWKVLITYVYIIYMNIPGTPKGC